MHNKCNNFVSQCHTSFSYEMDSWKKSQRLARYPVKVEEKSKGIEI